MTDAGGARGSRDESSVWKDYAQVWDPEDGSLLSALDASGEILGTSPCGRWLALEDGIVALDDLTVHHVAAAAAVFDAETKSFVLADADRVWRVRL